MPYTNQPSNTLRVPDEFVSGGSYARFVNVKGAPQRDGAALSEALAPWLERFVHPDTGHLGFAP